MDKARAVVTGGAGFLGSHLCERLLAEGIEVVCIDNLLTGNLANIAHLIGRDGFLFIKHDVTDYIHVAGPVDYVLHFASPASPIDYLELPIQTLKVGSLGTHKALGLAKAKGARFLLASTSEVYGDPLVHPQPEDYWGNVNPVGPRGVYDEAKRFAEAMTMAYHRFHGVDTRIVRIFNTYGPRMRPHDGRVVPAFISQALRGEPLTVFGDGSQTRSFCYVDDLVEGICRLLLLGRVTDPVNIGNPAEMTSSSSPRRSSASPAATCRSSQGRCPWTTPRSASPTSPRPARASAGSRGCRSTRAWPGRSSTSARCADPAGGSACSYGQVDGEEASASRRRPRQSRAGRRRSPGRRRAVTRRSSRQRARCVELACDRAPRRCRPPAMSIETCPCRSRRSLADAAVDVPAPSAVMSESTMERTSHRRMRRGVLPAEVRSVTRSTTCSTHLVRSGRVLIPRHAARGLGRHVLEAWRRRCHRRKWLVSIHLVSDVLRRSGRGPRRRNSTASTLRRCSMRRTG